MPGRPRPNSPAPTRSATPPAGNRPLNRQQRPAEPARPALPGERRRREPPPRPIPARSRAPRARSAPNRPDKTPPGPPNGPPSPIPRSPASAASPGAPDRRRSEPARAAAPGHSRPPAKTTRNDSTAHRGIVSACCSIERFANTADSGTRTSGISNHRPRRHHRSSSRCPRQSNPAPLGNRRSTTHRIGLLGERSMSWPLGITRSCPACHRPRRARPQSPSWPGTPPETQPSSASCGAIAGKPMRAATRNSHRANRILAPSFDVSPW